MPFPIDEKFLVAVASSALFNLEDSDRFFRERGEDRKLWREDLDPKIHVVRQLAREFDTLFVPLDGLFAQAEATRDTAFWVADGIHPSLAGQTSCCFSRLL